MGGEAAVLAPLAEAIGEYDQLAEDDHQLGLFSEPLTEAGKAKLTTIVTRRGPGRPPEARNKRTEATVAALLQRYRDPRAVALERIQMHPADLAGVLGCSVFDAAQEQRLYLTAVMPFLHARITPEVVDNRQIIHLTIGTFGGDQAAAGADQVHVLDPEQYQEVSHADDGGAEQPV